MQKFLVSIDLTALYSFKHQKRFLYCFRSNPEEIFFFTDSGGIRNKGYIDASSTKPIKTEGTDDFDFLLQQARAGIVRK